MRNVMLTLFIVVASLTVGKAQFNVSFHTGIGTFSMKEMRGYQNARLQSYPSGSRITSKFPSWYTYGVDIKHSTNAMQLGVSTSFGSTGGRIYYSDYSGQQMSKETMTYSSIGIIIGKRWSFMNNTFDIVIDPRPMLVYSRLESIYMQQVSGDLSGTQANEHNSYASVNAAIQPTLTLGARLGPLTFAAYAGYNLTFSLQNMMSLNLNTPSYNFSNSPANWSGMRLGGSVGINFNKTSEKPHPATEIGVGTGLDYGGIGLNVTQYVTRNVGFFAGVGYNFNKVGFNAGTKLKLSTQYEKKFQPFLMWMYGYNAVVTVKDHPDYNRNFHGNSVGLGFDLGRKGARKVTYAIILPIRNSDVDKYIDQLKMNGATFDKKLWPVLISVGFRLPAGK